MVSCLACGISYNTDLARQFGITFHRFPKNPKLYAAWIAFVGRSKESMSKLAVLCSQHFQKTDFMKLPFKVVLNRNVVPSIFVQGRKYKTRGNQEVSSQPGFEFVGINNSITSVPIKKEEICENITPNQLSPSSLDTCIKQEELGALYGENEEEKIGEHSKECFMDRPEFIKSDGRGNILETTQTTEEDFPVKIEKTEIEYEESEQQSLEPSHPDWQNETQKQENETTEYLELSVPDTSAIGFHNDCICRHILAKTWECTICDFKSHHEEDLRIHIESIHKDSSNPQMFKCHLCDYTTKYLHQLKYHILKHIHENKTKWYECTLCNYRADKKQSLMQHLNWHKFESRLHVCDVCDFQARNWMVLHQHTLEHKKAEESQRKSKRRPQWHRCSVCRVKFKQKRMLEKHILTHEDLEERSPKDAHKVYVKKTSVS